MDWMGWVKVIVVGMANGALFAVFATCIVYFITKRNKPK